MLRQLESDPGDRLGEYWRVGMNPNTPEAGWTRKDDGRGNDPPRKMAGSVVGRVHLLRYADLRRRDGVSLRPGSCGVFQCGEPHDIGRRSWLVDDRRTAGDLC